MIISASIFEAYLKCPSKSWFLLLSKEGDAQISKISVLAIF